MIAQVSRAAMKAAPTMHAAAIPPTAPPDRPLFEDCADAVAARDGVWLAFAPEASGVPVAVTMPVAWEEETDCEGAGVTMDDSEALISDIEDDVDDETDAPPLAVSLDEDIAPGYTVPSR